MFSIPSMPEISLSETEGGDLPFEFDTELPDAKGKLQTTGQRYTCAQKQPTPTSRQLSSYIKENGPKNAAPPPDSSPMRLAKETYQTQPKASLPQARAEAKHVTPKSTPTPLQTRQPQNQVEGKPAPKAPPAPTPQPHKRSEARPATLQRKERGVEKRDSRSPHSPLQSRQWSKEEPRAWWQQRYHEKEREEKEQGRDQREKAEAIAKVKKSANTAGSSQVRLKKPILERPKTGVFALYYILTKMGIYSDGTSNFSYKKEIEMVNEETTTAHKLRLDGLKLAIEKEQSAAQWGIASKVFSWIGSMMGIIAGIALIATGVGAVAGAMLVAGGLIQITNQILELTGGWKKIAELLPGDDPDKKRAVISWMQIGIAVLCLILSGAGVLWGGYSNLSEAMQTAMAVFGGVAAMGHGVTTIGEGVSGFMYKDKMSDVKRYDRVLAELKHKRRDLMERVEWGVDRLEKLFEDLAQALEFEIELFRADQMVNR
ncbi:MAG: hypothetical protein S4CHLAM2_15680 [Chlamydiales bacterium]|nr:hypothetical protein [Chlamydiales bacterium]